MISLESLFPLLAGGILFAGVFTAIVLRFQLMVRLYAIASFCLAALTVGFALKNGVPHLLIAAAATLVIKVVLIPSIVTRMVVRVGASMRLASTLRPTTTLFLIVLMLLLVLFNIQQSAFFGTVEPSYVLFVSVSMVLIGFFMMVLRRDIYSEIIGFLTLENGIALFGIVTIGSGPALFEIGIFSVILFGAVIMSLLSRRVSELYGTQSTDPLRELID